MADSWPVSLLMIVLLSSMADTAWQRATRSSNHPEARQVCCLTVVEGLPPERTLIEFLRIIGVILDSFPFI